MNQGHFEGWQVGWMEQVDEEQSKLRSSIGSIHPCTT